LKKKQKTPIVILGAGGHGSDVYSYLKFSLEQGADLAFLGFIDDHKPAGKFRDTKILGKIEDLSALASKHKQLRYITAIGDNALRREWVARVNSLELKNVKPFSLIDARASIGHGVEIGEGTLIAPGCVLTTNIRIGSHCIVNVNSSISHDSVVDDYSNINPGAIIAGGSIIGKGCFIGAGAAVIDKITVGEWSILGAGTVAIQNLPPFVTAVGVPARIIGKREEP